jgi:hypothetical protein
MLSYLPATLGMAVMLIGSTALAKERSEVEKSSVKAATDCVAASALNNPNITKLYQEHRLSEVTNWIVLKSDACDNPLTAMSLLHDQIHGRGTGRTFLRGAYRADLPRAVGERIKNELEKSHASASTGAQKQFMNHNDSMMLMEIGNVLKDTSTLRISYNNPSEKMSQLVKRGDLFLDGSIQWETREVVGNARIYRWGCKPLEYQVKGTLRGYGNDIGALELEGFAPTFGDGCRFEEFVFNHNSRLIFEPLFASAPLPSPDIGELSKGDELRVVNVAPNDVLNIREDATQKSRIIDIIPSDARGVVYLGGRQGEWIFIRYENRAEGWISSKFVQPVRRGRRL